MVPPIRILGARVRVTGQSWVEILNLIHFTSLGKKDSQLNKSKSHAQ